MMDSSGETAPTHHGNDDKYGADDSDDEGPFATANKQHSGAATADDEEDNNTAAQTANNIANSMVRSRDSSSRTSLTRKEREQQQPPRSSTIICDDGALQFDVFSLQEQRQRQIQMQQQRNNNQFQLLVLVSLYGQAGNREAFRQQEHALTILRGLGVPYSILDASDLEHKTKRDSLLSLYLSSSSWGLQDKKQKKKGPVAAVVYPQFYLVKSSASPQAPTTPTTTAKSGTVDRTTVDDDIDFLFPDTTKAVHVGVDADDTNNHANDEDHHKSPTKDDHDDWMDQFDDIRFFGDYHDLFTANERGTLRQSFLLRQPICRTGSSTRSLLSSAADEDELSVDDDSEKESDKENTNITNNTEALPLVLETSPPDNNVNVEAEPERQQQHEERRYNNNNDEEEEEEKEPCSDDVATAATINTQSLTMTTPDEESNVVGPVPHDRASSSKGGETLGRRTKQTATRNNNNKAKKKDGAPFSGRPSLAIPGWVDTWMILPTNPVVRMAESKTRRSASTIKVRPRSK